MVRKCAKIAVMIILIVLPVVIGAIYRNSAQAIYRKLIGYIPSENSRTLRVQLFLNKKLLEDGTPLLLGA